MNAYDFAMYNYNRCMNNYRNATTSSARLFWLHKAKWYREAAHNALLG